MTFSSEALNDQRLDSLQAKLMSSDDLLLMAAADMITDHFTYSTRNLLASRYKKDLAEYVSRLTKS